MSRSPVVDMIATRHFDGPAYHDRRRNVPNSAATSSIAGTSGSLIWPKVDTYPW